MAEKVLFESQSLYFSYNTAFGVYVSVDNPPPFSLVIGEKYKVLWDGTEYETTAIDTSAVMPNTVGAGNGAAWGYAGNNEPFVILYTEGNDISFISLTDTAPNTHTVSVYQMVEDVVVEDAILYTVSSTSLKKVADAVREKSGSADPISFPDGFVQKIASISGGGGGSSADVRYVTFMNGDTVLYKKPVAVGDDCVDVVTKGLISTPTKESTAQYNFTYYGWGATDNGAADANILKNITEDKTVYAIYTSTVRSYTITYLDDDGSVLNTQTLSYGVVPSYKPTKTDYMFVSWVPAAVAVTGDATYTASWEEATSFADMSWERVIQVIESGNASEWFNVGDKKVLTGTHKCVIVGFNHDDLSDGTGKAAVSLALTDVWSTNWSTGSPPYSASTLRTSIENQISSLPEVVANAIKSVKKSCREAGCTNSYTSGYETVDCKLWALSTEELNSTLKYGEGTAYPYYPKTPDNAKRILSKPYWTRTYSNQSSSDAYTQWADVGTAGTSSNVYSLQSGTTYKRAMHFGFCI